MERAIVQTTIDPDGNLNLTIPIGEAYAGREVRVTIESAPVATTKEEWVAHIQKFAGSIDDPTFTVHPQCMRCNDKGSTQP